MAPSVVIGSHGGTEPQRDGLLWVVPLAHTNLTTLMLLMVTLTRLPVSDWQNDTHYGAAAVEVGRKNTVHRSSPAGEGSRLLVLTETRRRRERRSPVGGTFIAYQSDNPDGAEGAPRRARRARSKQGADRTGIAEIIDGWRWCDTQLQCLTSDCSTSPCLCGSVRKPV